jgi:lipopolysaccharide/colanic/teichoic acid biosynthesis glycosyltransferase
MYRYFFKRLFDLIISIIGLAIALVPMIFIAIIIKIDSKGPVIFKQQRIGKNGKVYWMYKFRSMCVGAEQQEGGVYCVKGDKRVTKIGRIIRATSIDELPQFWNIIKGDMSLIGPRPVLTYYPKKWEEYTEQELKRFDVRPGVTGWAAVHGRKTNTVKARFEYDNYYVDISGSGIHRYGATKRLIDEIGVDKVIFGSDYAIANLQMYVDGVLNDHLLTAEEKRLIFADNAKRILDI